jgi:Na+/proline symporter
VFATWFGAETCLGAAGRVYRHGLSPAQAEPFAYGVCLVTAGLLLSVALWRRQLLTLSDLYAERFGPRIAQASALLMIPTSLLWAAAQVRGFGHVLHDASALSAERATAVAALIVVAYTSIGGMMADVVTDLVQGACLVAGLVAVGWAVVGLEGGPAAALHTLSEARVTTALPDGMTGLGLAEQWAVPVLGSLVAQELVARISAARSPQVARGALLGGGVLYVGVGLIPIALGLIAARHVGDTSGPWAGISSLADAEQLLPTLARTQLPTVFYIAFAGALVSAILSTVDSNLLVCSSLFSHNLLLPLLPRATERTQVRIGRLATATFGVTAYVLAVKAEGVYALVEQASAFGSTGILVITLFGLFSRLGGAPSAALSLGVGLGVYVLGLVRAWPYPFLASLLAALVGYLAGVPFGRRRQPATTSQQAASSSAIPGDAPAAPAA